MASDVPNSSSDDRLEQAKAEFLQAEENGEAPDEAMFLAYYPDQAVALRAFFANRERRPRPAPRQGGTTTARRRIGEYEVLREVGRGATGTVFEARHVSLNRVVALKVIDSGHFTSPEEVQRFRLAVESVIGLDHPNIVPVFEVGEYQGQQYVSMKLVESGSLARQRAQSPPIAMGGLMALMVKVARAVHHAHQRGVLHRDLKPANILLDRDGQPHVTDFGLPRRLDSTNFLPPELAGGKKGWTTAADVHGLGAVLYELLTGRPPFSTEPTQQAQLKPPRSFVPALDRDLEAICLKCLQKEPARRYRSAEALADDLERWLAGKPVGARPVGVARRLLRRVRRRPAVAALVASIVLAVVLGTAIYAYLESRQRERYMLAHRQWQEREAEAHRRQQEADAAANQALSEVRSLLAQARADPFRETGKLGEAREAARKAEEAARNGASEEVRRQALGLAQTVEEEIQASARDRKLLTALLEVRGSGERPKLRTGTRGVGMVLAEPSAEEQLRTAFREWGLDVDAAPHAEAVRQLRARPTAIVAELAAALDDWANERRHATPQADWRRLADLAEALGADGGPRRQELRALLARGKLERERALGALSMALRPVPVPFDAGLGEDRRRLRQLAATTDPNSEPVVGLLLLVRVLRSAGDEPVAERVLRAALRVRPQEVVLYHALGRQLEGQQRWREAVECYAAARALRPELGTSLARALVNSGRAEEGFALFDRLIAQQRTDPGVHFLRGVALAGQDRDREAEAAFREALRLKSDLCEAHCDLGVTLARQGRDQEAEGACRQALRLKPNLPEAHGCLGLVLARQKRYPEAEATCREALRLNPDQFGARRSLGFALSGLNRHKEAEAAYRVALYLEPDDSLTHYNLGIALSGQGKLNEAETAYRDAIRLRPDYAEAHCNLGSVLRGEGRFAESLASYRRGHVLGSKQPGWRYASAEWVRHSEQLVALDFLLSKVLKGEAQVADASALMELARFAAQQKRMFAATSGLFQESFRAHPEWIDARAPPAPNGLPFTNRRFAAATAAMAGAGVGDGAGLSQETRSAWRRQSRDWLREEIGSWARRLDGATLEGTTEIGKLIADLHADGWLAPVRGAAALARLSDDERKEWLRLWDDVEALRQKQVMRDAECRKELAAVREKALKSQESFRRQPADAATGRALADAYVRLFEYPKTVREYLAADAQLPDDPELWCNLAPLLLLGGEIDLHRQLCERALAQAGRLADPRAGGEQRNAYLIARMCALAEKPPIDVARILELARQSVDRQASAWHLHALGLACYRAGKYDDAVRYLTDSVNKYPGWAAQVVNYQALALTYHRLGRADEARRWRERAAERINQTVGTVTRETASTGQPMHTHDLLAMWLLEREIAQLLPASRP
jgi:serine/threonine-protein kinase